MGWGIASWLSMAAFAGPLAALFCADAEARATLVRFIWIASAAAAASGVVNVTSSALVALGKLKQSLGVSLLASIGLVVPCAAAGSSWGGIEGTFFGMSVGTVIAAVIGWQIVSASLADLTQPQALPLVPGSQRVST